MVEKTKGGPAVLPVKNGIRSVLRSPGKTVLFFFLLLSLTAVLALGLCVYSAVSGYLDDCDTYYQTIAELEYIGHSYPDSKVCDEALTQVLQSGEPDIDAMASLPGVEGYQPSRSALGLVAGTHRPDAEVYDRDCAVIIVKNLIWSDSTEAYLGIIQETLYSRTDYTGKGVFLSNLQDADIDTDAVYVFTGRFFSGSNSYPWLTPGPAYLELAGEAVSPAPYAPLDGGILPEDSVYRTVADIYAARNNGFRAVFTENAEVLRPFQQEELILTQGRLFDAEEYAAGAHVCVISDRLASVFGVTCGQSVPISFHFHEGGMYDLQDMDFTDAAPYTVVGIYKATADFPDWVFLPDSEEYDPWEYPTGYQVGTFVLDNDRSAEFYTAASAMLPNGFRLTVLDQGYGTVAEPFRELQSILRIFLAVCALVVLCVLALFGFLFVSRQREAAQTMLALGSGKPHVYCYFMSACGAIALCASALGAVLGRLLESRVLRYVAEFSQKYQTVGTRFSNEYLSVTRTLEFAPESSAALYLTAAAILLAAVLAVCAVFVGNTLKKKKAKKRKKAPTPKHTGHSSRLRGRLKYALLSIRRGGVRTAAVVLLAVILTVFLGQLTSTSDIYREQLASIGENTVIRGYASNSKGLDMKDLVIPAKNLQDLYDTGLLSSMDVSRSLAHYRYVGLVSDAEGNTYFPDEPYIPRGIYSYENWLNQMKQEPEWVATTSLTNSPEYFYKAPSVTWLEGYDESCLRGPQCGVCLLPETMMEREGIGLGSVIRVLIDTLTLPGNYGTYEASTFDLLVVGSYELTAAEETIYSPYECLFPIGSEPGNCAENDAFRMVYSHSGQVTLMGYREYGSGAPQEDFTVHVLDESALEDETFYQEVLLPDAVPGLQIFSGCDKMDMAVPNACCCMISEEIYEKYLHALGGVHSVTGYILYTDDNGVELTANILGVFRKTDELTADVYVCPTGYNAAYLWDAYRYTEADTQSKLPGLRCQSAVFTLKSAADLDALRDALADCGFTTPGSLDARNYMVICDMDYNVSVRTLNRQIQYLDALYIFLYLLTGVIALVVSYLLILSRKSEIAIMRGLGTQRLRIFLAFFTEQLLLLLLGCACGFGLWYLFGGAVKPLYLWLIAAFAGCWLLGSAVSIARLMGSKALAVLSDRE